MLLGAPTGQCSQALPVCPGPAPLHPCSHGAAWPGRRTTDPSPSRCVKLRGEALRGHRLFVWDRGVSRLQSHSEDRVLQVTSCVGRPPLLRERDRLCPRPEPCRPASPPACGGRLWCQWLERLVRVPGGHGCNPSDADRATGRQHDPLQGGRGWCG